MVVNPKDREVYQREYYEKRREEISQRRKERYHGDDEYRREAVRRAAEYRRKKLAERRILIESGKLPERKPTELRPEFVVVRGVRMKAHRISEVAARVGRSVNTLNKWIANGMLPQTPFRAEGSGHRLYTDSMILAVKLAIQNYSDARMMQYVQREWESFGVRV